ncbi:uncharacterized protein IL334_000634 [Kwoniella shivajii]|uniref:BTB domain-containing protein n=1 Tax=Kwoniella shivajii TaxID=564305 RepID=A0ABZ1CSQ3_9TREE|nr:hypothetical protein IL334_000634 [Kwoniella shivajii]
MSGDNFDHTTVKSNVFSDNPPCAGAGFHPQYKTGNLHIMSCDKVDFTVFRELLADKSGLFKDMEDLPERKPDICTTLQDENISEKVNGIVNTMSKIDVDANAKVVETFLALIYGPKYVQIDTSWEDTKTLYDICELYDCNEKIMEVVKDRLYLLANERPWDLLIWASHKDDRSMGADALRKMNADSFSMAKTAYHVEEFQGKMEQLKRAWKLRILETCFDQPAYGTITRRERYDWRSRSKMYSAPREVQSEETLLPFKKRWGEVAVAFASDDWFEGS